MKLKSIKKKFEEYLNNKSLFNELTNLISTTIDELIVVNKNYVTSFLNFNPEIFFTQETLFFPINDLNCTFKLNISKNNEIVIKADININDSDFFLFQQRMNDLNLFLSEYRNSILSYFNNLYEIQELHLILRRMKNIFISDNINTSFNYDESLPDVFNAYSIEFNSSNYSLEIKKYTISTIKENFLEPKRLFLLSYSNSFFSYRKENIRSMTESELDELIRLNLSQQYSVDFGVDYNIQESIQHQIDILNEEVLKLKQNKNHITFIVNSKNYSSYEDIRSFKFLMKDNQLLNNDEAIKLMQTNQDQLIEMLKLKLTLENF